MPELNTTMDVFKLLDKSNCRECGEKTCLAFAAAVFQNRRHLSECPHLDRDTVAQYTLNHKNQNIPEQNREKIFNRLKQEIQTVDLEKRAPVLNGVYKNGKLTIKILGKDFSVDNQGNIFTDIHVNLWVAVPLFTYVIRGAGIDPSGEWITFRELDEGMQRYSFFQKQCEEPLKNLADVYTDLFDDMIHVLGGKAVEKRFQSDISVVLHPLPKVPIMVCYWKTEKDLDSSIGIYFDKTANRNLNTGAIFTLASGLALMFRRFAVRHGYIEAVSR